jgi:ferredoxin-NADP reductase
VPLWLPDGKSAIRHYSICSDPAHRDAYEIAVLREDGGTGGSLAVHELFELGVRLRCGIPQNNFALHAVDRPAVLIAGGIGITAIKAMAHALKARGRDMHLHYAARSRREAAFREELSRELGSGFTLYGSAEGKRVDIHRVLSTARVDAVLYVCGPHRLIDAAVRAGAALGIDPDRIRVERFAASIAPDARPIEVELRRSRRTLHVSSDQTILDAALAAGIEASYGCHAGTC